MVTVGAPLASKKTLFLKQNRISLCVAGVISTCILLTGNTFFVLSHPGFLPFAAFILITIFYLFISYLVGFTGREFDYEHHQKLITKWIDKAEGASVDIYLPICGEPPEVIFNTWQWVRSLAINHDNVKVYVLDDGPISLAVANKATLMGFEYIRRNDNTLKKAGNLRHAFGKTNGEFILILDADFCPRADFLLETLPYFFEDENVAIVQTPQWFDDYDYMSWIQKGAASIQELFYRLIQVNRNTHNGAICVGTNAVYRRKSLEPFGGTAPIEYSEDVHTGFQIISQGEKIQYIPVILAEGVCPETLKQYFTQQYRWSLGSISLFFSKKFWRTKLSMMQRICYLSGMFFYITTGLSILFGPLPSLVMLSLFPEKIHWYNLLFSVPSFAFMTCFMWQWQKTPMSWAQLRCRYLSYFSHLFALKDYIFKSLEEWKPTGAKGKSERFETFKTVYTVHTFITTIGIFFIVGARVGQGYEIKSFILLLAFTLYHSYLTLPVFSEWFKKSN